MWGIWSARRNSSSPTPFLHFTQKSKEIKGRRSKKRETLQISGRFYPWKRSFRESGSECTCINQGFGTLHFPFQWDTFRAFARYASDPELSFSWYDAAIMSRKIRQSDSSETVNLNSMDFWSWSGKTHGSKTFRCRFWFQRHTVLGYPAAYRCVDGVLCHTLCSADAWRFLCHFWNLTF